MPVGDAPQTVLKRRIGKAWPGGEANNHDGWLDFSGALHAAFAGRTLAIVSVPPEET
jgi:hypothetical protein